MLKLIHNRFKRHQGIETRGKFDAYVEYPILDTDIAATLADRGQLDLLPKYFLSDINDGFIILPELVQKELLLLEQDSLGFSFAKNPPEWIWIERAEPKNYDHVTNLVKIGSDLNREPGVEIMSLAKEILAEGAFPTVLSSDRLFGFPVFKSWERFRHLDLCQLFVYFASREMSKENDAHCFLGQRLDRFQEAFYSLTQGKSHSPFLSFQKRFDQMKIQQTKPEHDHEQGHEHGHGR